MHHSDDGDATPQHNVVNNVREAPQSNFSDIVHCDRELLRRTLDGGKCDSHGSQEFVAQTNAPALIPPESLSDVGPGRSPNEQARRHSPRSAISSSTWWAGSPGSPSASSSALRRRNSVVCSAVGTGFARGPAIALLLGELDALLRRQVAEVDNRRGHTNNLTRQPRPSKRARCSPNAKLSGERLLATQNDAERETILPAAQPR